MSYSTDAMGTEVLVMRSAPGPLLCENVETAGNKHESQHLTNTSCLLPAEPRHLTLVADTILQTLAGWSLQLAP